MKDRELIAGLRNHDKSVITYLFRQYFPMIEQLVGTCGKGSRQDAEDVFMNALEAIYLKAQDPAFQLRCKFSTFLYEICKRQWYKSLRYKNRLTEVTFPLEQELMEDSILSALEVSERYRLYREKFAELPKGCQEVLSLVIEGHSMKEIAQRLGFASEQYARKRKFQCKKKLMQLVRSDARYQELIDHDGKGKT